MKLKSIVILALIIISCSENKENKLVEKINFLEFENSELKEKVDYLEELTLINTIMKPSFDKVEYEPNGKGKITFQAHKYGNFLFDYDVIENSKNEKEGKIIFKKISDSKFEYSFDLSKMESNKVNLSMFFQVNNKVFEIPAKAQIEIRK